MVRVTTIALSSGDQHTPIWMPVVKEFAAALAELTNCVRVVLDNALHVAVFLQHVGSAHLITSTILTDHVQLLLTHPCLRLGRVEKVLQQTRHQNHTLQ